MARLGSVLGAILADIARARLIADELTKGLVAEYRGDPILASMSIPRIVLNEASLTLRFTVSDLEEAPEPEVDASAVREAWGRHASGTVLPTVLKALGVPASERPSTIEAIAGVAGTPVGRPPLAEMRRAIRGEPAGTVSATAGPILDAWGKLPTEVRTKLGTKTAFRRELERGLREELAPFLDREQELALVRSALASRIDVAVQAQDLPEEAERIQELHLTIRGQDVEVLLETTEGSE